MIPYIAPINRFKFLAITPTALNSTAQRRVAHAGVPIVHMIEPQRGSTNNSHLPIVRFAKLDIGMELLYSSF